ncbi:S8 family peptidase [Nocardioides sp. B-3]|nr:S8 family peptidase [Nocardioides sp. B-3]UUZ58480.1 S8 family peptidase [Nocardioides sp. B-3]
MVGTASDGRYIVVLDKDAGAANLTAAKSDARADGARVTHTYTSVLDGFAAKLSPRALRGLRNNPNVAYIEADAPVQLTDTQSPATRGLDRIDQRDLPLNNSYTYAQSGAGVTAYIIDTGIRTTHSEFSGRAVAGYSAIADGRGTDDCNGHGTHVAGTVGGETYGVAQDVRPVAVRVLDCNGSGSNSGVIAGVDWVTQNHSAGSPAVANMSLGGGVSSALDTAVSNSIADGVSYALAAGNDSGANACNGSPGRVAAGLTIGSTTNTDARSSFSNIGSCLDLFAPRLEHHLGVDQQRQLDQHHQRHVHGDPARRGCGRPLPAGQPDGLAGQRQQRPDLGLHPQQGHQRGHRVPQPTAVHGHRHDADA